VGGLLKSISSNPLIELFGHLMDYKKHFAYYGQSQVLPFDDAAAAKYEELRRKHRRLSRGDLRIAAIALVRNAILVTQNIGDFSPIESLRTENWLA
jgi:tRNA(fMet)-specific endonuclease VapC